MTRHSDRLRRILCFFGLHKDWYPVLSRKSGAVMCCPYCGASWVNFRNVFRGDD